MSLPEVAITGLGLWGPCVGKAAPDLSVGRGFKTAFGFGGIDCALVLGGAE